jgi:hypothetical protein
MTVLLVASLALTAPNRPVTLTLGAPSHEISPYLFGFNEFGTKIPTMAEAGSNIARWGGNLTSRYNWRDDVDHSSNDWYFAVRNLPRPDREEDKSYYKFLVEARAAKIPVKLCIPIGDWIAKRPPTAERTLGSFPLSLYPDQEKSWEGLGNGRTKDGKPIYGNDPSIANIRNSAALQGEWLRTIRAKFGPAAQSPVKFIGLDNEVGLWHSTHRDAMPRGIWTTQELVRRNLEYARVVKAADPGLKVLGYSAWGHLDITGSDMDWCPPGEDGYQRRFQFRDPATERLRDQRQNRGGMIALAWYLKEVAAAEKREGKPLIDGISVNFYGAYQGKDKDGKIINLTEDHPYDPVIAPQQFECLRGWWDPTYINRDSWTRHEDNIKLLYEPVEPVIPKLQGYIRQYKPGALLGITEFEAGSRSHFHGALLRGALLGIYMRQDLDMACGWYEVTRDTWAFWGQRLYRNYDGAGSHLDGRYRPVTGGDGQLYTFAAENAKGTHLVIINADPNTGRAITIPAPGVKSAAAFTLREDKGKRMVPGAAWISSGSVRVDVPPMSAVTVRLNRSSS